MNLANFLYWIAGAGLLLLVAALVGAWLGEVFARRAHAAHRSGEAPTAYLRWESDEMAAPASTLRVMARDPDTGQFRMVS